MTKVVRKDGMYAVLINDNKIVVLESINGILYDNKGEKILPSIVITVYIDSLFDYYNFNEMS